MQEHCDDNVVKRS